jgi:hypothetical protein
MSIVSLRLQLKTFYVVTIMRSGPKRFFIFSPQTKYALSVYLDLKENAEAQALPKIF